MNARSCSNVRADLSAYLDGDLDAGLADETRIHLEGCAACRDELDLLRRTVGVLRRLPDLPPPAALLAGVRGRLRPEPWYRRRLDGRQWRLGVPIGAFATLLVVIGISLFQARFPDMTKTVTQIPSPQSPAVPALKTQAKPMPIAPPPPADRVTVADRQAVPPARNNLRAKGILDSVPLPRNGSLGEEIAPESAVVAGADKKDRFRDAPAAPAEPVASTDLDAVESKAERAQPAQPEPPVASPKEELLAESRRAGSLAAAPSSRSSAELDEPDGGAGAGSPPPAMKLKSRTMLARDTDSRANLGRAELAGDVASSAEVRVVCLLLPDGDTLDDLERLLRSGDAGDIVISVIGQRAIREAFAPHRGRLGSQPEPARGWSVTASVPPRALARLLDALANRSGLRVLEQPAAQTGREHLPEVRNLRITVLR